MTKIVRASIAGDIVLLDACSRSIERLRQTLRVANPAYSQARFYGKSTDGIAEYIECLVERPDGSCCCPRGAIDIIRSTLAKDDYELRFVDNLMCEGDPIDVPQVDQLWPHQESFVGAAIAGRQGLVVSPCGSGKTTGAVAIAARLGRKTVVVVPTEDLMEQWIETIREKWKIQAGTVRDRTYTDGPIVVAMAVTLRNMLVANPGLLDHHGVGVLLIDEADIIPASTYQQFLKFCRQKYRFGFTATPEREDRLDKMIEWSIGPTLYEISTKRLIALGHLMAPQIEIVESAFEFNFGGPDRKKNAALQKALREDAARNALIAGLVVKNVSDGEHVVVLSNDKQHCRTLARLIWEAGVEPRVLFGGSTKTNKRHRKSSIQGMRDGDVRCIIATSLFDKGVDILRLSRVVLALPQRAKGRTQQRTGRTMRLWPGKQPKIYDIVDPKVDTLVRRFYERRKTYRAMGIEVP